MNAEFDAVAKRYDEQLNRGLSLSGEPKEYFALERMKWLKRRLDERGFQVRSALDFGCGTGTATPYFFEELGVQKLTGTDPSSESLALASGEFSQRFAVEFGNVSEVAPGSVELAFCNGVFHHILPKDRSEAFAQVHRALADGGLFAFWENNPWNPGTRWAMSRVPFDADAVVIWPGEARRLLTAAGFEPLEMDFLFYFPRALKALRPLEKLLFKFPLGGQYLVLARKAAAPHVTRSF
jgi:SAM-dependent methyltransferase